MTLTPEEIEYLASQRLGRIATVAPDGQPQVSPTSFHYNAELGTVDVGGGSNMGRSKKYRNVQAGSRVSLVVDDIASFDPWVARGVEVRGEAEAVSNQEPYNPGFSGDIIRIHPRRIISWGLDGKFELRARDVPNG